MPPTIDHLRVDHAIRVIAPFVDADGVSHGVGEQGLITDIRFDWGTSEIFITWSRDGRSETMRFVPTATSGPGNGRMKQFFEVGEYVPSPIEGKRLIPGIGYVPIAPEIPAVTPDLITSDQHFDAAITRIWALAARKRFAEAQQQLTAIFAATDRRYPRDEDAAERLCRYAMLHAYDDDLTVHQWLREQGVSLWYSYGSQATSGGEGTERARHIRAAERNFEELDRKLGRTPRTPTGIHT